MTVQIPKRAQANLDVVIRERNDRKYRLAVISIPEHRDLVINVLVDVLGLNAIDARARLRRVPGVWPEQVDEETAGTAADLLEKLGADIVCVDVSEVPSLQFARTLHHVRCEQTGFEIVSISEEVEQTIPWSKLALMSVADVADLHDGLVEQLPDGVFRHAPGIAQFLSPVNRHGLEMWLLTDSPFEAFRIDAELMNYEALGDQLLPSSDANFRQLVTEIREHATQLSLTPVAQNYVNRSPVESYRIDAAEIHRDLVLAYWITRPTVATGQQVEPSSQSKTPTASPSPVLHAGELLQSHRKLHEQLEALRDVCGDSDCHPMSDLSVTAIGEQLERLEQALAEHFAKEEEAGYMSEVLEFAPRYGSVAEAMQQQHEILLQRLSQLRSQFAATLQGGQSFIEAVESHEHAENAVVQSAYLIDLPAGD